MAECGWLLLSMASLSMSASDVTLPPARLTRGDTLVFRGQVVEGSERISNRFRKTSDLTIQIFVLAATETYTDCVITTSTRRRADAQVAAAVHVVAGTNPVSGGDRPMIQTEFIRMDSRGRIVQLMPAADSLPILLDANTPSQTMPPPTLDGPPLLEWGMFVPLPPFAVHAGVKWDTPGIGNRPPVLWLAARDAVWNGGRCLELTAEQRTPGWDRIGDVSTGWRRRDTLQVVPTDGFACRVQRKIEHREGRDILNWVEITYELTPPTRYVGTRFGDVRQEAETAWLYSAQLDELLTQPMKVDPREFTARKLKIDRFLSENPIPTLFRPALEAVRLRYTAAEQGQLTTVAAAITSPAPRLILKVGQPVPDFIAPPIAGTGAVRLGAVRGKPVVLVFFRPEQDLSTITLFLAETLYRKWGSRITVLPLSVAADVQAAYTLHARHRLTVPIVDGTTIRQQFQVDSYPRFLIVDTRGNLAYRFDGIGNETGYLLKREIERLLPAVPGTATVTPSASPAKSAPTTGSE